MELDVMLSSAVNNSAVGAYTPSSSAASLLGSASGTNSTVSSSAAAAASSNTNNLNSSTTGGSGTVNVLFPVSPSFCGNRGSSSSRHVSGANTSSSSAAIGGNSSANSVAANFGYNLSKNILNVQGSSAQEVTTNIHESASDEFLKSLLEMYKQEVLCDVELIVGSHHIKAHKVILAASSPYFRAMFAGNMRESSQTKIELHDMDGQAAQLLIDFVYTHEISLSPQNIFGVLCAANQLSFMQVIEACTKFLKHGMNFNNCVVVRNWAEHLNIGALIEASDTFISNNFLQISGSEEFNMLPYNAIKAIVANPSLNITCETEVFEAVLMWVKSDLETRSEQLYPIMRDVRLAMIPKHYLISTLETDPVFKADAGCRELLNQAKSYHLMDPGSSSGMNVAVALGMSPDKIVPRHATAGVLFCIGGRGATGDPFRTTEVYNPISRKWFHIAEMSTKRRHVGVCSINGKVYAAGGHDGKRHLKSVEMYDTQLGQWSMLSPMQTHRRGLAVVSLGSAIFAVGGLDDSSCFDTVERYDTMEDQWTSVASMNHRRGGAGLVALEGNLYAIGGNDGVSSLSCCEKYDPYLNKWIEISSMTVRRAGAGIAVYGGRIFAAGGFDDNAPLKCVECYDPETNSWTSLSPMLSSRGGVGLACLAGKLYAVGGHDGSNYLDTVETYDPLRDVWEPSSDINVPRAGAGVVAVNCLVSRLQETTHKVANVQSYV